MGWAIAVCHHQLSTKQHRMPPATHLTALLFMPPAQLSSVMPATLPGACAAATRLARLPMLLPTSTAGCCTNSAIKSASCSPHSSMLYSTFGLSEPPWPSRSIAYTCRPGGGQEEAGKREGAGGGQQATVQRQVSGRAGCCSRVEDGGRGRRGLIAQGTTALSRYRPGHRKCGHSKCRHPFYTKLQPAADNSRASTL